MRNPDSVPISQRATVARKHPLRGFFRSGEALERLAAGVQAKLDPGAKVTWNERMRVVPQQAAQKARARFRQIDVAVRGELAGRPFLAIAECRDYSALLGVGHVDRLDSVRRQVRADRAILVTSVGYSADALATAADLGIETYVLRPNIPVSSGQHANQAHVTISQMGITFREFDVELADGRRIPRSQFRQVRDVDGAEKFLDRIVTDWLLQNGRNHPSGAPLGLEFDSPLALLLDGEEPPVVRLRCVPEFRVGLVLPLWLASAEWIFEQLAPDGPVAGPTFFQFQELRTAPYERGSSAAKRKAAKRTRKL